MIFSVLNKFYFPITRYNFQSPLVAVAAEAASIIQVEFYYLAHNTKSADQKGGRM